MIQHEEILSTISRDQISAWFDETIAGLQGDKFLMQENLANPDTARLYTSLINGNNKDWIVDFKDKANAIILKDVIVDFITHLITDSTHLPNKLAFSTSNDKLLVWAEIKENDEVAEDNIIMAEAKVNGKYYNKGFSVSSTIIEDCDNIKIPLHYIPIPIQKTKDRWQILQNT